MDFDYQPHFEECVVCERKILIEVMQFGVSHIAGINAICQECVLKSPTWKDFKKQRPKQAEKIKAWAEGKLSEESKE